MAITYQEAGVDQEKAGKILASFSAYQKTRPLDRNIVSGIGPFASCYSLKELLQNYDDPVLVTCCDGVGTKAKLAVDWNEVSGLGLDLVAMNVNDLLCAGAKPLLFLDYYACGKLIDTDLLTLLKSIQRGCEISQCSLVGGETAEMPGLYREKEFDLAGFSVGIAEKKHLLGPQNVKIGDTLVAIASSGFHSNGYSLIRTIVEKEKLAPLTKSPFSQKTWKETLLEPTIIYVPFLLDSLSNLHALAHLTGGGLFENLARVLPSRSKAVVSSSLWTIPELFQYFQEKAGLDTQQLLSTFNCGVGMIAVCEETKAATLIQKLRENNLNSWVVGTVEREATETPTVVWA